ncbi:MAG: nicotinate mononucleotide-dependent phosphoribosyltransferase CobT [Halodesulfurarchaeum sp.]
MQLVLVVGTTETARIDGISAAGVDPEAMRYTPTADAEIVVAGEPVTAPTVPVSPTGCPTPALVTRAVRDLVEFDVEIVTAGVQAEPGIPHRSMEVPPGGDVRDADPVPDAETLVESGRALGRSRNGDTPVVLGESIPGGTTTALGTVEALGERLEVSSSLPENPVQKKRGVIEQGLRASGLEPGDASGDPVTAVKRMGDPVLGTLCGLAAGALQTDTEVILGGGTQMLAVVALLRHAGIEGPVTVATTAFVANDETVDLHGAATTLGVDLLVTDPGFDHGDHVALERYEAGEAKEGVGMGGVLAMADRAGYEMEQVRNRIVERYEASIGTHGP